MLLQEQRESIVKYGLKLLSSGLTTGSGGNLSAGEVVEGELKPSSELSFHLALYHARPEVNAVVHTHSVYATTMACLQWEIPAVHYLVGFAGNKVPLAPYATFGSTQLAHNVVRGMGDCNAVLLANHGLVAVGGDMSHAFNVAEEIELVARIYYQCCNVGTPVLVPDAEMETVLEKFKTYGQQDNKTTG
jgi:L-fuculose-phosphate aldolase